MEGYERYTGAVLRDNRFCGSSPREVLREAFKANLISDDAMDGYVKSEK